MFLKKFTNQTKNILNRINFRSLKFTKFNQFSTLDSNAINTSQSNQSSLDNLTNSKKIIESLFKNHKEDYTFKESHENQFYEFIQKIEGVMKKEYQRNSEINKYKHVVKILTLQGREPIKDILSQYTMHTNKLGFEPELICFTLETIGHYIKSRDDNSRTYNDLSNQDFLQSYNTIELINDLKFGLTQENTFFKGEHIARTIRALTNCGYKEVELLDLLLKKTDSLLLNKDIESNLNDPNMRYADKPSAGKRKFYPTNYASTSLMKEKNFKNHIFRLMKIQSKSDNDKRDLNSPKNNIDKSEEFHDLTHLIKEVISLASDYKEVNSTIADSVNNLVEQYYKIEQTILENSDASGLPYIKFKLYQLQDKLIEAGFLNMNTYNIITKKNVSREEFETLQYNNSLNILHEFFVFNYPDMINKDIFEINTQIYELTKVENFKINEPKEMNSISFSSILSNLSDYAKILQNEIKGKEYYNKAIIPENLNWYEKILGNDFGEKYSQSYIPIKYEYTIFYNEILKYLKEKEKYILNRLKINKINNVTSLGLINYAYSNIGLSVPKLKEEIIDKSLSLINNQSFKNSDLVTIIKGLHYLTNKSPNATELTDKLLSKVELHTSSSEEFSIHELISLLWASSSFNLYKNPNFLQLLLKFNEQTLYSKSMSNNDNMYLQQFQLALKKEAVKEISLPKFSSKSFNLDVDINNSIEFIKGQCMNDLLYDPLKKSLVNTIKRSLCTNELERDKIEESTTFENLGKLNNLPFNPDLVVGFYGYKIAIFVLGKDYMSDDFNQPNGYYNFVKKNLHDHYNTFSVFISINEIYNFDLSTLQVSLSKKINMETLISSQLKSYPSINNSFEEIFKINSYFNTFVKNLTKNEQSLSSLFNYDKKENVENFLNSLLNIFELNTNLINQFIPTLITKQIKDINVEIIRNLSYFDTLSPTFRNYINNKTSETLEGLNIDFKKFILTIGDAYKIHYDDFTEIQNLDGKNTENLNKNSTKLLVDDFWMGKRLDVDLITNKPLSVKDKNIYTELINNNIMWYGDYCHYSDWDLELQTHFDKFNYFIDKNNNKYLFNNHPLGPRNVPSGVFPLPNKVRKIKNQKLNDGHEKFEGFSLYEYEMNKYKNFHDYLIDEEIKKNRELTENIPLEITFKTSLLNLKNGLKQNMTEEQIIKFIVNFDVVEGLIEEANIKVKNYKNLKQSKFVQRNSESFKNFYKNLLSVVDIYDEYDKFLMKEIHKEESLLDANWEDKQIIVDKETGENLAEIKIHEKMKSKIEENEDTDTLSIYSPNQRELVYDEKSILGAFRYTEVDLDLENSHSSDLFLYEKRKKAERNIILLRIIHKLYEIESGKNDVKITENEKVYLRKIIDECKTSSINEIDKIGINMTITNIRMGDLNENDLYTLQSIPYVEFKGCEDYSFSDIALELSQFIDNNTIIKFLKQIYSKACYEKFSILNIDNKNNVNDISLFEIKNKEPTLMQQEIKENLWRLSGTFNSSDKLKLLEFIRVKRGKSKFDKSWLTLDEKSFNDFIESVNPYENRLFLLEQWLKRKEKEVENRINLPKNNNCYSDQTINKIKIRKENKRSMEVLYKIFGVSDLSLIDSKVISNFVNEFCSRLYLFNFDYPEEIKTIMNGLFLCSNLTVEDRNMLKKYKLFFKLQVDDDNEYLASSPIKLEGEFINKDMNENFFDQEKMIDKLKKSHINYITPLVNKLFEISK